MEKSGFSKAEIREIFAETDRRIAETDRQIAETNRQMAESKAEFDRKLAASAAEFDRKLAEDVAAAAAEFDRRHAKLEADIKNTHENINGISDSNGMLAQEYFFNALKKKLTFAGVHFDDAKDWLGGRRKKRGSPTVEDQFDIVLVNKAAVAILEVKHRARTKDVDRLVDVKLKSFKYLYGDIYGNHKVYLGVAAMTFDDGVLESAKEHGVGIIRQVGETVEEEGAWEVRAR